MSMRNSPNPRARRAVLLSVLLMLAACIGLQSLGRLPIARRYRALIGDSLGVEATGYKAYPTSASPGDFYGRVYTRTRVEEYSRKRAGSLDEASALAGFTVFTLGWLPTDLAALTPAASPDLDVTGEHAYTVRIDFAEARRILEASGIPVSGSSADLEDIEVAARVPPSVVIHLSQGERWFTLIQGGKPIVIPPDGLDPGLLPLLDILHLRSLGLTAEQAGQIDRSMGWGAFLVVPPTDLLHAEITSVNEVPALALYQSPIDSSLRAVLWESGGVLYGLYGNLIFEELLKMAASLIP